MKISISWLKELIDLNCSIEELVSLLPLRTIGIKEVTDQYIELDMKGYNRADLLSMQGMASEVSAITGSKRQFSDSEEANSVWNQQHLPKTQVEILNPELAPFYTITKIESLKVGKSPEEWVKKLADCGIRSINNIADITNLMMLEFGQPMHAFDADKVNNGEIIVRAAKNAEEITTLDGKKRKLTSTNLLITDPKKPIGVAGVMGGKNTEVSESTNTILLEAAIFDPVNIRKTATSLRLQSEASKRFQHGLTKKRLLQALNAAIKMYESLGGKVTEISMAGEFEDRKRKVTLTKKKLDELVGVQFENKEVEDYLEKLGFKLSKQDVTWEVEVPYYRLDIKIEEDLIEEVARMYGYEKIPSEKVPESKPLQSADPIFKKIQDLKNKLVNLGLTEVQTYSFYSTGVLNALNLNKNKLVKVSNPISLETEYLRQNIWPNLVESVGRNIRQGFKDIGIFEIGKTFNVDSDGNPQEEYRLAIALMNGADNPIEELSQIAQNLSLHPVGRLAHGWGVNLKQTRLFHPTRQVDSMAEVHLRVLNKLGIEKRVAVLEIQIS